MQAYRRDTFLSPGARRELREVRRVFGRDPSLEELEKTEVKRFPSWRSAKTLYLATAMFEVSSPVRTPENDFPVPLYTLPLRARDREAIHWWAESYRDLDRLWIASGKFEIPAYKELADPGSELSTAGRCLSKKIEKVTGKPTYYYMMRYYGRRHGESERRCPGCGGEWSVSEPKAATGFGAFEFRCKRCRLVSHMAVSEEDERHARIGEWRRRR